jgi:transcriptional regulator with XRE-family HTH domain
MGMRREALAARRTEKGYTQEALARRIGVAESTVRRWELGATDPRLSLWTSLADALDLPLNALRRLLFPAVKEEIALPTDRLRLSVGDIDQFDEIVRYLRDQWHTLVRADNLLGPRFALRGVLDLVEVVEALLPQAGERHAEITALAGRYAESAAWLHEDAGQMSEAGRWVQRAMEWAIEAGDELLLAWTVFRRSQHATASGDGMRTISLTRAAIHHGGQLPNPMRATILQQEAQGHALAGNEVVANNKLDEARQWASLDDAGDARGGHGSFCTETYIELNRAHCWTVLGKPRRAIAAYERMLPALPAVYRRDRGMACSRFANAYLAAGEPEAAAVMGREALAVAHSAGSIRIENQVRKVAAGLKPHQNIDTVRQLCAELARRP